ncbi:polyketide synthase [Penicillium pulvis]|uniref:polyketide synthase n=1 Tax=Penicillium pulvis TaxID=1562058 RepID=UPI0025489ADB|nr:polyketide synthase [Penicillium pulvis]KAJ5809731.1 polyketide synthase [Penicillium pulvis]
MSGFTNGSTDGHVGVNGAGHASHTPGEDVHGSLHNSSSHYIQEPVAVVSMACRLPDSCHTPRAFWRFLEEGRIAINTPPGTRYSLSTHYDGSLKPQTMASPGGMYLQDVDPRDLDAQFFRLSGIEATSMDPQQRQLLEVVYEGLENAGVTLEQLDGASVGCFVSSFASDYGDMQARDPENRAPATVVGVGRAMLSNRLSHFLNIKGPSMTIDTACSGALIGIDLAMRYLQSREISSAIVAGANLYCSPEHVMDHYMGANGAASLSGRCHTFDSKADGYIKAEAVNMVYLKRLSDAIKDKDPIRAIIRGTATNSDGWTAGIASPNPESQSAAIRQAYQNAGIKDLSLTSYVEFHGTGTRAGDSLEANGVATVFTPFQKPDRPLRIGSVKSNIGHSEPAAGLSGLLKTVLSLEKGVIPGNPTFLDPSPKIDFEALRLYTSRTATLWPKVDLRRASINSFGYGGSNAHIIVDEARALGHHHVSSYINEEIDDIFAEELATRPHILVFSANDEKALEAQATALDRHLSDPAVKISLRDLAYTLSERRSHHYHRSFAITSSPSLDLPALSQGHITGQKPRVGFVLTGQGAQWPTMGKELIQTFPLAARTIQHLDRVLQEAHDPPSWALYAQLTADDAQIQRPELSQPLVTALQLALLAVFKASGVVPQAVVGHSSGEIAAAVAAGYLSPEQAILIAYYRGKATSEAVYEVPVGMMAVGLGPDQVLPYLEDTTVEVACVNSPQSVTLSGTKSELVAIEERVKDAGYFARLLRVDAAYHSRHMKTVAGCYEELLKQHIEWPDHNRDEKTIMVSSTTGATLTKPPGPAYWVANMVSPVLFSQAAQELVAGAEAMDYLLEIGPSDALSGPINQIKKAASSSVEYGSAWKRGAIAVSTLLHAAGTLFTMGYPISLMAFNDDAADTTPVFVSDLPNYQWNHTVKYWHESESSLDWRYRKFPYHDLLGSKILGSPWTHPVWKNVLRLSDTTWLRDHTLGDSVIFPAAGYIAMAIEAIYQKKYATGQVPEGTLISELPFKLRNVTFPRMLTLDTNGGTKILLSLQPCSSTKESWHEFIISTIAKDGSIEEHCRGVVSVGDQSIPPPPVSASDISPLQHPVPGAVWYKAMRHVGYHFGPAFQPCQQVEAKADSRHCRAMVRLQAPESRYPQSHYAMHPAAIDGCLQIATVALNRGHHSAINTLMPPAIIDNLVIFPHNVASSGEAIVASEAVWSGVGRPDDNKRYVSDIRSISQESNELVLHLEGLRYHAINASAERPHAFTQVVWNPDIDFITSAQTAHILQTAVSSGNGNGEVSAALTQMAKLLALIAHKRPSSKVIEVALRDGPMAGESLYLDHIRARAGPIALGCSYRFLAPSQQAGLVAHEKYAVEPGVAVQVVDAEHRPFDDIEEKYDFIVLKVYEGERELEETIRLTRDALTVNGYLVVVRAAGLPFMNGDTSSSTGLDTVHDIHISRDGILNLLYVGALREEKASTPLTEAKKVHLLQFDTSLPSAEVIQDELAQKGWDTSQHSLPFDEVPPNSTVLIIDEVYQPILSALADEQFTALRGLLEQQCRVLWVTRGSQMRVTHPEQGLMFGVARSLRAEYPSNLIMCLDIESTTSAGSLEAIDTALRHITSATSFQETDSEFVERDGMYHVSRVVADDVLNQAQKESEEGEGGASIREGIIHDHKSLIRLISERPGTLDTLVYREICQQLNLADDEVEIEVHAAGMNFKDLANAMGFVPANEHLFGLECTGVVTQIGDAVRTVKPGDRVLMVRRDGGCFANRVRNRWHAVHLLPDWVSFEAGTTLGIAIHTAVYGLVTLANLQKGQSVLIHSASGGVGLAAIELCHYLGAEVYVTVGTDAKRDFLAGQYGVSRDRMFSSRSTAFAKELMQVTNGRGVDICLNSLTGDMLHESWRCIAENGTLVEIGKKDMLDRNSLSMEPFDRNCSYRALDLSRKSISDETTYQTGVYIMDLVRQRHIKPLHIGATFSFTETVDAFRYMQRGKHIGKVVLSFEDSKTVPLPFRPAGPVFRLRDDGSYLIAGGLKGLCGSIAVYLARNGAKNIVVICRSGYEDARSQKIIYDCQCLGCHVDQVTGDITSLDDVRHAFTTASMPVIGVIQGAMVLRDRMFSTMTPDEFRQPIAPKVAGTWNLHQASLEQPTCLDFFTLLSSVSGLVGQLGQANYAAGNTFLDSFAAYRLQQGLPACSINLGPIEEVGYLANDDQGAMLNRVFETRGWTPIHEALLHQILRISILQQTHDLNPSHTGQLVTAIMPGNTPFEPVHRFSALAGNNTTKTGGDINAESKSKLLLLKKGSSDTDHAILLAAAVELVNPVLMRSLGIGEPLDPTRPLSNYGVDSLVAVELKNWIRQQLEIEVSALEIVGARTLTALCETLLDKLVR